MLINFSNHPSGLWGKEQYYSAILEYNSIIDMPFPSIDPEIDDEGVKKIANEYLNEMKKIIYGSQDHKNAVHVMGELTFVYVFVDLLKKEKIQAMASVSKREVYITPDSVKHSRFSFAGFRNYFTFEGE